MKILEEDKRELEWFEQEDFWRDEYEVVFNKQMVRFSFLEVEKLIRLTGIPEGAAILDLCCGIGRHATDLARRGYDVTGIDITAAYLEIARQRSMGIARPPSFILADARSFELNREVDLVINMFNSFGYFNDSGDDRSMLQNCYNSLQTGGKLLMELLSKEVVAYGFKNEFDFTRDNINVRVRQRILDNWNTLECCWQIHKPEGVKLLTFRQRLYAASELEKLLLECGFFKVGIYGDLGGKPFDEKAEKLVMLATK